MGSILIDFPHGARVASGEGTFHKGTFASFYRPDLDAA